MTLTPAAVLERAAYEDALGNRRTADMLRALADARNEGLEIAAMEIEARQRSITLKIPRMGDMAGQILNAVADELGRRATSIRALKNKENRHD